jgi:hypothetical protein
MTQFMDVVVACLGPSGMPPLQIKAFVESLDKIALNRPDLVERYDRAIEFRDAREIERIWFECKKVVYLPLRINGITGRVHFGHSSTSVRLFPPPN